MVKSSTDFHRVHVEKWWINTIYRILQSHYEKRSVQINWPPCWKKRHSLWVHERNSNKIMHSHFYLCALNVSPQIRIRFVRTDLVTENRHEMNELCLWIFASGEEKKSEVNRKRFDETKTLALHTAKWNAKPKPN